MPNFYEGQSWTQLWAGDYLHQLAQLELLGLNQIWSLAPPGVFLQNCSSKVLLSVFRLPNLGVRPALWFLWDRNQDLLHPSVKPEVWMHCPVHTFVSILVGSFRVLPFALCKAAEEAWVGMPNTAFFILFCFLLFFFWFFFYNEFFSIIGGFLFFLPYLLKSLFGFVIAWVLELFS